jgi:hypothetical protein
MNSTRKPTAVQSAICACCGRALKAAPTIIMGLPYGPECRAKAAALEGYLASKDISLPAVLDMVQTDTDSYRTPEQFKTISAAVRAMGGQVEAKVIGTELHLSLKAGKITVPVVQSYAARRADFANSLGVAA